ncbi:hypothetical protein SLA2020_284740 [Shorea laevis]
MGFGGLGRILVAVSDSGFWQRRLEVVFGGGTRLIWPASFGQIWLIGRPTVAVWPAARSGRAVRPAVAVWPTMVVCFS